MDAGKYTGNIVALPNNRVRVTHPAWFKTGEGAPDFRPSQRIFHSKQETEYVWDTQRVFNNLYICKAKNNKKGSRKAKKASHKDKKLYQLSN